MKSILIFFLWILACIVGFAVLLPIWLVFVTSPRMVWHTYRNSEIWDDREWEQPWFPLEWLSNTVKRLDKKNKVDKSKSEGKVWVAGSG